MIVEIVMESEAALPTDLDVKYIGSNPHGMDTAFIDDVEAAEELIDGSVRLILPGDARYEIANATIVKSGASRENISIPGEELALNE